MIILMRFDTPFKPEHQSDIGKLSFQRLKLENWAKAISKELVVRNAFLVDCNDKNEMMRSTEQTFAILVQSDDQIWLFKKEKPKQLNEE